MIKPFAYFKPPTMDEALEALTRDGAQALAGGTDLLVDMRNGIARPALLVDIKNLSGLNRLQVDPGRGMSIGAGVTLNMLAENEQIRACWPAISQAAASIATYQLRNRATLLGNICHASPAADMAPPLYVLDAQVVLAGPQGERRIPIQRFFKGVKKSALQQGELAVRVEIPPTIGGRMAFLKKQRLRGHDVATVNVAGLADRETGILRISVGACAVTPLLIQGTDRLYQRSLSLEELARRVAELARERISPIDDVRSCREYRRDLVGVLVRRLIRQICA